MGAGDIDGDGWKEIAVGAKGKPFVDGNWFAYWKNPGKDGVKGAWKKVRSRRIKPPRQIFAPLMSTATVRSTGLQPEGME